MLTFSGGKVPGKPGVATGSRAAKLKLAVRVALVRESPLMGKLLWVMELPGAQNAGGIAPEPMKVVTGALTILLFPMTSELGPDKPVPHDKVSVPTPLTPLGAAALNRLPRL